MMANFMDKMNIEYEVISNAKDGDYLMEKYRKHLKEGKKEGYTPLIIILTDYLLEKINLGLDEENLQDDINKYREIILKKSETMNIKSILEDRKKHLGHSLKEIMGEFEEMGPMERFGSYYDYETGIPYEKLILAKIPTTKPWELAAWVPMGGFNNCPKPEEQVAIFKYWHEKYGATPSVVGSDTWEMYIERPVEDKVSAEELALEQVYFADDIVFQGMETVRALASVMIRSKVWYFWWD